MTGLGETGLSVTGESSWREAVRAYIRREATPADKFGHQPRLYALCCQIVAGEGTSAELGLAPEGELGTGCDDDVLFAAAWMHDLGVFLGHRPADPVELARWNHVPYTIARSGELLAEWEFPAEKLARVAEAIRTHEARFEAVTAEAVVLRDADILEQLGAIGALRAIAKVGRDTRFVSYSDVMPVLERAVELLPAKLRLTESHKLAVSRIGMLQGLLMAIREEAGDNLY